MKYYIVHFNNAEERYYFEKMVNTINDNWSLFPAENSKGWILQAPSYKDGTEKILVEYWKKKGLFKEVPNDAAK